MAIPNRDGTVSAIGLYIGMHWPSMRLGSDALCDALSRYGLAMRYCDASSRCGIAVLNCDTLS